MKQYAMIIDLALCENCQNCFLACKDEFCGNDWPGYSQAQPLHGQQWMTLLQRERGQFPLIDVAYLPKPCQHCDDAPCVAAGKGAVVKRPDGIVLIDPQAARGRQDLPAACPYGAIWWNGEQAIPQKCTFCAHLLDSGWKAPRCVQACPTGALRLFTGSKEELEQTISREQLEILPADRATPARPRCYYKNLWRFSQCFIRGSVIYKPAGIAECLAGARVLLWQDDQLLQEQLTDAFGDFCFDRLIPGSSAYVVEILGREKQRRVPLGTLAESCSLPVIDIDAP